MTAVCLVRAIGQGCGAFLVGAGLLFAAAGRADVPAFWAYAGVLFGLGVAAGLAAYDSGLAQERFRPGPGGRDRLASILSRVLTTAMLLGAGLDVGRCREVSAVPTGWQVVGLLGTALGFGMVVWAVSVNRFFSPVVRVQHDRGHHVIDSGPYCHVRHPGYLGMVVGLSCSGLALGSWWSLLPAGVAVLLVLRRTALEDRFLREHLEGYPAYAARVPYRLVMGIW